MKYFSDRKFSLYLALIVVVVTSVPYLLGFASQGDDWQFTGFVIGVEDGNSYIAKMLRGAEGDWLFNSSYSSIQERGVGTYLPYLLLGKLTAGLAQHEQLVVLYQLFRVFSIFVAVFASADFISIYIAKDELRNWALVLIMLGGGLGWILVFFQQKHFLGSVPLEFFSPESFGFLGIMGFPHLVFSRALLLWGLATYLKNRHGYLAGICWLMMGFFQPLVVVIAWIVIGTHVAAQSIANIKNSASDKKTITIITQEYLRKAIQAVIISSPIVIYTGWAFITDPYLIGWLAQNLLPSPHVIHYLFAYGLMLPIVFTGLRSLFFDDQSKSLLIIGWILILPILVYLPINSQRRLSEGVWVAIVVAALAFFNTERNLNMKWKCHFLLAFPSSLIIIMGAILTAIEPAKPAFRPKSEIAMYRAFDDDADSRKVVLSSYEISNNLPAWVPVRVVLGHGVESINRKVVELDIKEIFSDGISEAKRKELLDRYHVDYIVRGPNDIGIWTWSLDESFEVELIYNQNDYSIFQVQIKD